MIVRWLIEGARSLLFLRVRWERVEAGPARLAMLAAVWLMLVIGFQRLWVGADALFDPKSLPQTGFMAALMAWASYTARAREEGAPVPAQIMSLLLAQLACLALSGGLAFTVLLKYNALDALGDRQYAMAWTVPVFWATLAQLVVFARAARRAASRLAASIAVGLAAFAAAYLDPASAFWRLPEEQGTQAEAFAMSQEMIEEQLPLLDDQITALKVQRPGVIDMYTITFAPYEGEEVFRRESDMVSNVMARRFDADGRGLRLLNHRETVIQRPWATPLNLQRAIEGIAGVMDTSEDVLFIHLTSHGASNGELAAQFAPLEVAPVIPAELKKWLDEAGIRYRVLSISACYSGSWIDPLAGDGTLVMSASDADHTSFGCGSKSDLTFFGRAMYDEQLRKHTLSFEQAHTAARPVIRQREIDAGKDDGYSNPQIKAGQAIQVQLARQRAQLAARARPAS